VKNAGNEDERQDALKELFVIYPNVEEYRKRIDEITQKKENLIAEIEALIGVYDVIRVLKKCENYHQQFPREPYFQEKSDWGRNFSQEERTKLSNLEDAITEIENPEERIDFIKQALKNFPKHKYLLKVYDKEVAYQLSLMQYLYDVYKKCKAGKNNLSFTEVFDIREKINTYKKNYPRSYEADIKGKKGAIVTNNTAYNTVVLAVFGVILGEEIVEGGIVAGIVLLGGMLGGVILGLIAVSREAEKEEMVGFLIKSLEGIVIGGLVFGAILGVVVDALVRRSFNNLKTG